MKVQLLITGDTDTGAVGVQGPIDNMALMHWLLGEAKRACERRADDRDAKVGNGKPSIIVAHQLPGT